MRRILQRLMARIGGAFSFRRKDAGDGAATPLFAVVADESRLSGGFRSLRELPPTHPIRMMLDECYAEFHDADGNFVEQFQTTGFDARFFELYLSAYFNRSGFEIDRSHSRPDFVVSRSGEKVAVEATTTNRSTSGPLQDLGTRIQDLDADQLQDYKRNELAIRFGSALYSKLQKQYWKLEHCKDLPIVLAIQPFHDDEALSLTDSALTSYLFGLDQEGRLSTEGELFIETSGIHEHSVEGKEIPSRFFGLPNAEHISAVVFSNSGTTGKFARMGFQHGYGNDRFVVSRFGNAFSPDPQSLDPVHFSYNLECPPIVEPWGDGLVVLHNPYASHPLPHDYFPHAAQGYLEEQKLTWDVPQFHPFASKTVILDLHHAKSKWRDGLAIGAPQRVIMPITQSDFSRASGFPTTAENPILEEAGWFTDETTAFLATIVRDRIDDDWGYVILARDRNFMFFAVDNAVSLPSRNAARLAMQSAMIDLLAKPRRIFQ